MIGICYYMQNFATHRATDFMVLTWTCRTVESTPLVL